RVTAERIAAVVEIEGMGGDAIDQRGVEHVEALAPAEDQRRAFCRGLAQRTRDDRGRLLARARERHPDGVENALLRRRDSVARQRFERHPADAICKRAQKHAFMTLDTAKKHLACYGPGSAAHPFASLVLRCAREHSRQGSQGCLDFRPQWQTTPAPTTS